MTKIWVISDYQRDVTGEIGHFMPAHGLPDADVLVVAGDFHPPLRSSVAALARIAADIPVIYVPGNRDYYGQNTIEDELLEARRVADTVAGAGLHILDNEDVVVAGVRFVGATLWSDLEFQGGLREGAHTLINDFRAITVTPSTISPESDAFTPAEYRRRHLVSRQFIQETLSAPFDGPTVVITHHSPHANSVGERFATNIEGTNALFHSDLTEVLEGPNHPSLWIHGATHVSADYRVGGTRVVSNPYGYQNPIENPSFVPDLVIDLDQPT